MFAWFAVAWGAEPISVGPGGQAEGGGSACPALSADGQVVAFLSSASFLVHGDTNEVADVFVRDRRGGTTTRISVDPDGVQASASSFCPALSADGRFVAFASSAPHLVVGDTNAATDVFVHDRQTGITEGITVGATGDSVGPSLSADGRFVVYQSDATDLVAGDTNGVEDVFRTDRQTGTTVRVSEGGVAPSTTGRVTADGQRVAFVTASPLGADDDNGVSDVYLRDLAAGTLQRISPDGPSSWPGVSADGTTVVFQSDARLVPRDDDDLRDVYIARPVDGTLSAIDLDLTADSASPATSADGGWVAFVSGAEVFVHRPTHAATARHGIDGGASGIALSADGRTVAFPQGGILYVDDVDPTLGAAWSHAVPMRCPGTSVAVRNADPTAVRLVVGSREVPLAPGGGTTLSCEDTDSDWLVVSSPGPLDVVAHTPDTTLWIPGRALGADLSVVPRLVPHRLAPGGPIAVRVTVEIVNRGPQIARGIVSTHAVAVSDAAARVALGQLPGGATRTATGVRIPVGDLRPGAFAEITFWAMVTAPRATQIEIRSTVGSDVHDGSPDDDHATVVIPLEGS